MGDRCSIQRRDMGSKLVRRNPLNNLDVDLCHALLNSVVTMFIIEGMGFGHGLGVLDLSKNRIEEFMHMLDPRQVNENQATQITMAFAPLLQRDLLEVADELESQDRQDFDDAVLAAFGIEVERETIYDSLLQLLTIRQAALDRY